MATVLLSADPYGPAIYPKQYQAVFVKRRWAHAWTYVPYLWCVSAEESVAPSIGTCTLRYDFGYATREDWPAYAYYSPWVLDGYFVQVVTYNSYGSAILWVGTIQVNSVEIDGHSFASGQQNLTAFELSHLLDRQVITGAYTDAGRIERPLRFNGRAGTYGRYPIGNRGTLQSDGQYTFGETGTLWSNYDVAVHVLTYYRPLDVPLYFIGQLGPLQAIFEEHSFDGMTLWQALNKLIDRRRGLGFRVAVDVTYGIIVYVYSILSYPLAVGNSILPANYFRVVINFDNAVDAEPVITVSNLDRYSRIVVRGGPLRSCFTVSPTDGTLDAGWTSAQEIAYALPNLADANENDAERATDKYSRVWQYYKLDLGSTWLVGDGLGNAAGYASPLVRWDASIDTTTPSVCYNGPRSIDRQLPFVMPQDTATGEPEYRPMFVLCYVDDQWVYIDRLSEVDRTPIGVRPADQDLAIFMEARPNHLLALGYWDGADDTNVEPEVSADTLLATVMVETDQRITINLYLAGYSYGRDSGGTKLIEAPEYEVWYVVPQTVQDVTEGALVRHSGGIVRDDRVYLRRIAALAQAWYAERRSTISWRVSGINLNAPCGNLVAGVVSNWHQTQVGTVVTRRRWDFTESGGRGVTAYETGYDELNFAGIGGRKR